MYSYVSLVRQRDDELDALIGLFGIERLIVAHDVQQTVKATTTSALGLVALESDPETRQLQRVVDQLDTTRHDKKEQTFSHVLFSF